MRLQNSKGTYIHFRLFSAEAHQLIDKCLYGSTRLSPDDLMRLPDDEIVYDCSGMYEDPADIKKVIQRRLKFVMKWLNDEDVKKVCCIRLMLDGNEEDAAKEHGEGFDAFKGKQLDPIVAEALSMLYKKKSKVIDDASQRIAKIIDEIHKERDTELSNIDQEIEELRKAAV